MRRSCRLYVRNGSGREADGGCAATDEKAVGRFKLESFVEGAPGGLEHFRNSAELLPTEVGSLTPLQLLSGNTGELGVSAIEVAAHAAHNGSD